MNWEIIWLIARKDLRSALKNPSVSVPMLIVPLIFLVGIPLMAAFMPLMGGDISASTLNDPDLQIMFQRMPESLTVLFSGLDGNQIMVLLFGGLVFAPFFLIIPLMYASVIAAEAFAGERERKTIESLLYSPASDAELFLGKVLAAFIPSVLISWVGFVMYSLVLNGATWISMRWTGWFPLPTWYPLIFWISPAISLLSVAFTVLISSRNPTFMGTYQLSSSLVLIVVAMMGAQLAGVLYLTIWVGLGLGLLLWLAAAGLLTLAIGTFSREALLTTLD